MPACSWVATRETERRWLTRGKSSRLRRLRALIEELKVEHSIIGCNPLGQNAPWFSLVHPAFQDRIYSGFIRGIALKYLRLVPARDTYA